MGGGGGAGGSGGRGGRGGTGGSGGGSGGTVGATGGAGNAGTDGGSNTGGGGGAGTGGVLGFGATGGDAGSPGAGGTGGPGGTGGAGGIGGSGGRGGDGGGCVVFAARGLVQLLPQAAINISASLPEDSGDGGDGAQGTAGGAGSTGASGATGGDPGQAPLLPISIGTAKGGDGGTGGASGGGGGGAGGGKGGKGGAGGFAVPGMLKVHGSVVLAANSEGRAQVIAENAAGNAPDQNGRYSVISNMSVTAASEQTPDYSSPFVVEGFVKNDALLLGANPVLGDTLSPWLPQLTATGAATAGYCEPDFWNRAAVLAAAQSADVGQPVVLVRFPVDTDEVFSNSESVFADYDQVYLVNLGAQQLNGVVRIQVDGFTSTLIEDTGVLAVGQIWTTTVPAGAQVQVEPALVEEGQAEGIEEGLPEGIAEGEPEGVVEGSTEGSVEGTPEGAPEGLLEGEGLPEGQLEGEPEGVTEGISEGFADGEGEEETSQSADIDADFQINLNELLRVIQLYNAGAFHCEAGQEDGFATGTGDILCVAHSSDYAPQDWIIQLSELLRLVQFFNVGDYRPCDGEGGFCPGAK
jgi:hypothetical protein